jgi:hypothetical protein
VCGGGRGGGGLLARALTGAEGAWCAVTLLQLAAAEHPRGDALAAALAGAALRASAQPTGLLAGTALDALRCADALLARGGDLPAPLTRLLTLRLLPPPPALPSAALSSTLARGGLPVGAHGRAMVADAAAARVAGWAEAAAPASEGELGALGALLEAACALAEAGGALGDSVGGEEEAGALSAEEAPLARAAAGRSGAASASALSPLAPAALRLIAALLAAAAPLRDPLVPSDHLFSQHSALLASALASLAALPPLRAPAFRAVAAALACGAVRDAGSARRLLHLSLPPRARRRRQQRRRRRRRRWRRRRRRCPAA